MTLYFYADETNFKYYHEGKEKNAYGYGVLITRYSVEETDVIAESLNKLKLDPDINQPKRKVRDENTLRNKYFHACDDSPNAHSHLCTSIKKHIQGRFRYDYDEQSGYLSLLTRSCLDFSYRDEPIILVVEGRTDFQESNAHQWVENVYRFIETMLFTPSDKPAYFPEIRIEIGNKENSGLQVTDFILWAINRTKKETPDMIWFDRLKLEFIGSFNQTGNKLFTGGDCRIGKDLEHNYFRYPKSCFPLKQLPNNSSDLVDLYLFIEEQLLKIDCTAIPNHVSHFQEKINKAVKNLNFADKINVNNKKIIQEISSIYIRLFDTFPLYQGLSDNDVDQWSKFLLSRQLASYLLFKEKEGSFIDQLQVERFYDEVIEYKHKNSLNNKSSIDSEG